MLTTAAFAFSPPAKDAATTPAKDATTAPCCAGACSDGKNKYFSVDVKHGFCGETCMHGHSCPIFKIFESNLTKAVGTDSPCKDQFTPVGTHYTVYNGTVTHGVPPLTVTLDLYAPGPKEIKKKTTWRHLQARGYDLSFAEYCAEYGKDYAKEEAPRREGIFRAEMAKIMAHNEAEHSWKMGLSVHTDKTEEEWHMLKGLNRAQRFAAAATPPALTAAAAGTPTLPSSLDWRTKGVVTPVKDQGGCGSCWAFSATETVESALAMSGGPLLELAPQQLVSCAPNPDECGGTGGCAGSTQPLAFDYLVSAGGMEASAAYPYTASDGTCKTKKGKFVAGITGHVDLPTNNYSALMEAVATVGPIAISVDASWGGYEEGVYTGGCGTTIDHAVQLVGYGEEGGALYYLVRNSWGTTWGEDGYIKIQRFGEGEEPCGTDTQPADGFGCKGGPSSIQVCGLCGILSGSSYPTGAYVPK